MKKLTALILAALMLISFATSIAKEADPKAKYVFFFIGDGMSNPHTTAAQYYLGTKNNPNSQTPVSEPLSFTRFPVIGQMSTYSASSFAPDSASTATSMASGEKTLSGIINFGFKEGKKSLEPDTEKAFKIITEYVKEVGMRVGIISTVSLNHATPAAFYARSAKRNAYYDIGVQGLSTDLVDFLGGGGFRQTKGVDGDQKNLIKIAKENGFTVLDQAEEIRAINADTGRVLAISPDLQDSQSMQYEMDRLSEGGTALSLAEMTAAGIRSLETSEKGFFMMIESGKIDWAAHANDAAAVIHEVLALSDAVQEAITFSKRYPEETLIVVTGDHETGGLTIGYAGTGYSIHMEYLQSQELSSIAFDEVLYSMEESKESFDNVMTAIRGNYGLTTEEGYPLSLDDYEMSRLYTAYSFRMLSDEQRDSEEDEDEKLRYGGYDPLSMTAAHILANKAGLNFSTYSHTGLSLPVYAIGAGSELFSGGYDNTAIFSHFMDAMGLQK